MSRGKETTMNSRLAALGGATGLIALVLAGAACLESPQVRRNPKKYEGLDRRLDAFTYVEEGKLVALAVGTQATRYREEEAYIPLAVGIANKGVPVIKINRESFLLYDDTGKRFPMAPFGEINERYHRTQTDRNFTTFFEIWNGKFPAFSPVDSSFFPVRTSGVVFDRLELPKFHYASEYLYFPRPEGKLLGRRYELHMEAEGLPDPVFVKFLVD
jgi:hypothetical protein